MKRRNSDVKVYYWDQLHSVRRARVAEDQKASSLAGLSGQPTRSGRSGKGKKARLQSVLRHTCRSQGSSPSSSPPYFISPILFSSSSFFLFSLVESDPQLDRVDSLELASVSSASSAVFTSDDSRSTTGSSGEFSRTMTGSSGEIPALLSVPEGRVTCVGRNNKGVTWGSTSVIGRRKVMEDAVAVIPGFMTRTCDHVGGCAAPGSPSSAEIPPVHFFGVYDGHGGSQVANFCAERMHEVIAQEWDKEMIDGCEWQRRWHSTLLVGFERTDSEVLTKADAPEMVGSTAVVIVLSGCQIITLNCGDSRAILCRGTETIALTVDQKPDREDELIRIESEGGRVINWNGARVFGVLAMSRAIGDRYLRPWIIPVPEITFTARTDEDECLILASDGLWDVMTNDEVGEVARHILRRRRSSMSTNADDACAAQAVADHLTEIAYGRNSSDNISIIVVDLKAKRKRHARQ